MMGWALKLFLKGKIGIFPTFKGGDDLKVLFEKSEREEHDERILLFPRMFS